MRTSTIVMIGFAILFGVLAVFLAQTWLNHQSELRMKSLEAQQKQIVTKTVVVAARALPFGSDLSSGALKEVAWPEDSIPAGAFHSISQLTSGQPRLVLQPIEANEPILPTRLTGPGERATLSALLVPGMKAVTVRVNDVDGVAGFVLPGDRVDVGLTRQQDKGAASNDIILQNVKVLAIDQLADERAVKPTVGRSATLEVDTTSAQKLALAGSIGTLSLLLRKAGDVAGTNPRRVTVTDLVNGNKTDPKDSRFATIKVFRASKQEDISVPVEDAGKGSLSAYGE